MAEGATLAGCSRRLLAAGHDDLPGAHGLDDFKLGEHRNRGIDLRGIPRDEGDHRGGGEINGFAAEVLDDLQGLGALLIAGEDLDHDELLDHGILGIVLGAVDHIDEFIHLHDDLLESLGIAGDADGHTGEIRVAAL